MADRWGSPNFDVFDDKVQELLRAWGVPYGWGCGAPSDAEMWPRGVPLGTGGRAYDCGGFAQHAAIRLSLLDAKAPDRGAFDLANVCDAIEQKDARPGDLFFYGPKVVKHVMVALSPDAVIGACGGTSKTHGDDPRAFVAVHRAAYRKDLIVVGRIRRKGL